MATADIQCLLRSEDILLAVDKDGACSETAVDNAKLTVVEEIWLGDGLVYREAKGWEVLQLQVLVHWHRAAEDETVIL